MSNKHSSEAIVLRKCNYQNSSSIITMYTKNFGKQVLMAKGVRRYSHSVSRIDYGYLGFVEYIAKDHTEVQLLTNFELYEEFYTIRQSLRQIYLMANILNVVNQVTVLNNADDNFFNLLSETLKCVSKYEKNEILPWFLVSMLNKIGIYSMISSRNWMQSTLNYMINNSILRVNTLKLTVEQISAILAYVRDLLLDSLHIDIDFSREYPLEYLYAS